MTELWYTLGGILALWLLWSLTEIWLASNRERQEREKYLANIRQLDLHQREKKE